MYDVQYCYVYVVLAWRVFLSFITCTFYPRWLDISAWKISSLVVCILWYILWYVVSTLTSKCLCICFVLRDGFGVMYWYLPKSLQHSDAFLYINKIQNPFEVLDHEMKFRLDVLNIFLMTFLNFMSLEKFSVLNDHDTPAISELWFSQMIWIYKNFTMIYWNSLIFIEKMLNSACYGEYDFLLRFRSFMNFTMFIKNLWFCLRKFS